MMPARHRLPLGLLLALLTVGAVAGASLAGCGGGGQSIPTSSLSGPAYAKQAEAICAKGRRRGLRYQPTLAGGQTSAAAVKAIRVSLLPAIREVADSLHTLGAPAERKAGIEAFLEAFEQAMDEAEALETPTFARLERVFAKSGELALNNGLEACVYGRSVP